MRCLLTYLVVCVFANSNLLSEDNRVEWNGDALLSQFFQTETAKINDNCMKDVQTLEDWQRKRPEYVRQLKEMLGLPPIPIREEMHAQITQTTTRDGVVAEALHFQSLPGLYVTGTLFRPEKQSKPLPAILYVCGHGRLKENGISYGNKATYQHHGVWFAKHGYVCLMIDTIQLGEIEGLHHGTYREEMWWWHNQGYTPAGVEACNGIRAIDYLQTRPEVDAERIGITGRSGGGAYSWWIAALDERIKVAVPVAGITSMQNHIVDGCIEGHCDCMYMVNTYAWDFPLLAALVAPRPLLISNTDKDRIFPLDGVVDVYSKTRRIYELHDAVKHVGLNIAEGPHKDTQELRINAFHWFNRFLKDEDPLISTPAEKIFTPQEQKVFQELPEDEVVTSIQDSFVKLADKRLPQTQIELDQLQKSVIERLKTTTFRNVDLDANPELKELGAWRNGQTELILMSYDSDDVYELPIYILKSSPDVTLNDIELVVCDHKKWVRLRNALSAGFPDCPTLSPDSEEIWSETALNTVLKIEQNLCLAYCVPRGVGPTAWNATPKAEIHIKRRMALLGHTVDSLRTYDVIQCLKALRSFSPEQMRLNAYGEATHWALMASILSSVPHEVELHDMDTDLQNGPYLLQVSQHLTKEQALLIGMNRAERFIFLAKGNAQKRTAQTLENTIKTLNWPTEKVYFIR